MAARRKRGASRPKNGKKPTWSRTTVLSQEEQDPSVPEGDFFPPGFSAVLPAGSVDRELTTYFLHTEKRGLSRYLPMVLKHHQKGFRAVVVTKAKLVFDQKNARIAGRVAGDCFEEGLKWVKRSVLDELQTRYISNGGGTLYERERTVRRFFRAIQAREEIEQKRLAAEKEFEEASVELVLRFGKKPFVLPGSTVMLDACCGPGDKVYWRSRSGKMPELGE